MIDVTQSSGNMYILFPNGKHLNRLNYDHKNFFFLLLQGLWKYKNSVLLVSDLFTLFIHILTLCTHDTLSYLTSYE